MNYHVLFRSPYHLVPDGVVVIDVVSVVDAVVVMVVKSARTVTIDFLVIPRSSFGLMVVLL